MFRGLRTGFCVLLLVVMHGLAVAAPDGGSIVGGAGSIDKEGNKTTITQDSSHLVVDWESFNVGQQEHVHFEQGSASDSALNRIYDSKPSEIWGSITGRGRVWLLNPNGVIFSKTARVSTGGLVAAGLWMDKQDFMSGRYVLSGSRGVGDVRNAGSLESGNIALMGRQVSNSGTIRATSGSVALASGKTATVDFTGDGLMRFAVSELPKDSRVSHTGSIEAGEVRLSIADVNGVFSGVLNTDGVIKAAKANGNGGSVSLAAAEIEHRGSIDADGGTGGSVNMEAGRSLMVSGGISARGNGGISTEQAGGSIRLTAKKVVLDSTASIDASAATGGGGEVLIGGGWQGGDGSIRNAVETEVKAGAIIKANANIEGDGGTIVVWSDGTTRYAGHLEATGGELAGAGGEAEVSGKENLLMRGTADLRATNGKAGHLLLDPGTVRICDGMAATGCANDPTPDATAMPPVVPLNTFTDDYIATQLTLGDLSIMTSAAATGSEDINVDSDVSINWRTNRLTLDAGNDINLDGSFGGTLTGPGGALETGALELNFGNMLSLGGSDLSGVGTITATGDGSSTLAGPAGDTAWTINSDSVTVGGIAMTLSMVNILQGGAGADAFTVSGASSYNLMGGDGMDTVQGPDADTAWIISGTSVTVAGTAHTFMNVEMLQGGSMDDMFTINGMLTGSLDGGAGDDSFTFNIGGGVSGGVAGGAGADTFDFNGGTVAGAISGGADSDTLDFAGITAAITVTLTGTPNGNGFGGSTAGSGAASSFSGINVITGGSATTDRLQGLNAAGAWVLGASDSYTSGGQTLMFSALEDMTGGVMADTFMVDGVHMGDLSGAGGADSFTINAALTGTASGGIGNDRFTLTGGSATTIDGGAGTDTVQGPDANTAWTISGASVTIGGGAAQTFTSVETLQGGSMVDMFTVSAASSYNLMGAAGADSFTIDAALTGSLDGGTDGDTFSLNSGGSVSGTITGGAGTDTLNGTDASTTWTVTGGGAGTIASRAFASMENLVGGSMVDTFTISGAHTGDISGGAGNDMFTLGASGSATSIDGGVGTDTLNGADVTTTWTVTGGGAGTIATRAFSGMENLVGGSMVDTFTISGAHMGDLSGEGGADSFTINAALTGTASGGIGNDMFTLGASGSATSIDGGVGTDTVQGPDADIAWTIGTSGVIIGGGAAQTFTSVETLQGGSMVDTFTVSTASSYNLMGGAGADSFSIGAALTGSLDGGTGGDTFSLNSGGSVSGTITGGAGSDTFDFNDGTVAGAISGGADSDTLDFADIAAVITVTLTGTPNGNGFGGSTAGIGAASNFSGINVITGGGATTDSLQGLNAAGAWVLGASDSYASNGQTLMFSALEDMTGGGMVDTFTVDGVHTGDLSGAGGADSFTMNAALTGTASGGAGNDRFTLTGGSATTIDGGDDTDTVQGPDANIAWTISGASVTIGGGAAQTFTSVETLQGGSMVDMFTVSAASSYNLMGAAGADSFTIDAALTGSLDGGTDGDTFSLNTGGSVSGTITGGAGTDTLNGTDASTTWTVTGGGAGTIASRAFSGMENLVGGSMVDTFTISGAHTGDISGGAGNDMFTLGASGSATSIDGGVGTDTLNGADVTTTWTVTGGGAGTIATRAFSGMENLVGGSMVDSFTISGAHTGDLSGEGGADSFTMNAALTGTASGGIGNDRFTLTGGSATTIDGGDGTDTVQGPDANTAWTISGASVTIGGGAAQTFTSVETLQGGSMVDMFTVSAASSYNLMGAAGADSFTIDAALTGSLDGGTDGDTFSLNSGGSVSGTITGGTGTDTLNGTDASTAWTVTGGGAGTIASRAFASMENLVGGSMVDTFTISGAHTGDISGGAGNDMFTLGASGSATSIDGGVGTDTLNGADVTTTWTITGGGAGTIATRAFSGMENLVGGSMVDTFTISGAHMGDLSGEGGADSFTINAALTGTVSGDAGNDMFTLGASGSATSIDGGDDTDTVQGPDVDIAWTIAGASVTIGVGTAQTFTNVETLQGGSMVDMFTVSTASSYNLMGGAGADSFTIDAALTGSLDGGTGGDTFSLNTGGSVSGTITAGAGSDTFDFNDGTVAGAISGGADSDTLDFADIAAVITVTLTGTPNGNGFGGSTAGSGAASSFSGINVITGGGATTDSLQGLNAAGTWVLGASDSYASNGQTLMFSALEDMMGGGMVDTFTVDGVHTGNLSGAGGADRFTINAALTGTASGGIGNDMFTLGASGRASTIDGGGDTDTVQGPNVDIAWTIAGASVTIGVGTAQTFTNVETLQGGSMVDMFTVSVASPYNLMGGAGADSFTIESALTGSLDGGVGGDTFSLNTGGSVSGTITAGAGSDTFDFNDGTVAGAISGGADSDTLDFADIAAVITVTLTGTPNGNGFGGSTAGIGAASSFSGINVITGGGATTDSLQGLNAAGAWVLGASDSYASNGQTLMFSALEDMMGGGMVDTFTVDGVHTGNLSGAGGADRFTINAALTGTASGGIGNDMFTLGASGRASTIDGGGDTDTVQGPDVDIAWTIAGASVTIGVGTAQTFTNVETLQGGSMVDMFTVSGASSYNLMGGAGADSFTIDAALTGSLDGGVGGDTFSLNTGGSVSGTITGGTGTDTLNGADASTAWTVTGGGAGTIASGAFASMENLVGGSMVDTFTISGAHTGDISGGAGDDAFNLNAVVTGSIMAGAGADTLNLGAGGDIGGSGSFSGGAASDVIVGMNTANTWTVNGGTVNVGSATLTLSDVEILRGGSMVDTFTASGAIGYSLEGGGGADILSGTNAAVMWDVAGTSVTLGTAVFMLSSVELLQGGSMADMFMVSAASSYNIMGGGGADTFTINAALTGDIDGGDGGDTFSLAAAVTGALSGGGGVDTFNLDAGGMVSGMVSGNAGADILSYATRTTPVTVAVNTGATANGFAGTAVDTGGFADISDIRAGGATNDRFTGSDGSLTGTVYTVGANTLNVVNFEVLSTPMVGGGEVATTWIVTGNMVTERPQGGTERVLMDVSTIQGGSMVDTVMVTGVTVSTSVLTINGGGGNDVFTLDGTLYGQINGGAGDDSFTFNGGGGVMSVAGASGGVDGGAGADIFDFNGGIIAGALVAGGDSDTLDFADIANALMLALSGTPDSAGFSGSVSGGAVVSFTGINVITGGSGTDSVQGLDAASVWTLGASDSYVSSSRTLMFSALENMQGGTMVDMFTVDGAHTGNIVGGSGADTFTLSAALTGMLAGNEGDDVFNVNSGSSVSAGVSGDAGADTFDFNGGTVSGTLAGGADSDTLDFAGIANGLMLALSGTPDGAGFGGSISGGTVLAFSGINVITGGSGTDTIQGLDAANTWTLGAADSYASGSQTLMFSALENLQGGSMVDSFTVSDAHSGMAAGGAGDDGFVLSGSGLFTAGIDGEAGTDTVNGRNMDAIWTISGAAGSGMVVSGALTQAFAGVENLNGGSMADTFDFNGGMVAGLVAGGSGVDTLDFAGLNIALTIALTGTPDADGFAMTVNAGASSYTGINVVTGGSGSDMLQGLEVVAMWMLGATDSYAGGGQTLMFSALENMLGRGLADTFIVNGAHSGNLQGAGGADTFTIEAALTGNISGTGGIDTFTLSAAVTGMLAGGDGDDVFNLNSGSSVSAGINGGDGGDNFVFNGGMVSGEVAGGTGDDILNFSALATAVMVSLSGPPDVSIGYAGYVSGATVLGNSATSTNGFTGINRIIGSTIDGVMDTFSGINQASTFTLAADGSGTAADVYSIDSVTVGGNPYNLNLDSIESYIGGSNDDSYVINREYTGNLEGGGGVNSFTVNAAVNGNIIGGAGDDAIVVAAVITGNVDAGGGSDSFSLLPGGRVVGSLALGEGEAADSGIMDVIDLSMFDRPLTLIYDQNGGQAYVADDSYGTGADGQPDAVIMSDGHIDGMANPGARFGFYGAERIIGAAHDSDAGTGTYFVVQPAGPDPTMPAPYVADIAINGNVDSVISLMLPDLRSFLGHVMIGGSGAPPFPVNEDEANYLPLSIPGVNPSPMTNNELLEATVVQARRLIIAGDIVTRGSLLLIGSAVALQADVYTGVTPDDPNPAMNVERGNSEVAIVATGAASSGGDIEGNGLITSVLADMERERAIASGHGVIIISGTFENASNTVIDLGSGRLQFAQGDSGIVQFNPSSRFLGATIQPAIDEYIRQRLGLTELNALVLSVFNPANDLSQTGTLFIDTSLFEQDLTLFSLIGKGISLYLSLCEEVEGCAPPVELVEIDALLKDANEKLVELKLRLRQSGVDVSDLVRRFEKVVRDLIDLRREFVEIFGEGRLFNQKNGIYEVSIPPWEYMTIAQADL